MRTMLKTVPLLMAVAIMGGCATNIKDLNAYKDTPLSDTEMMPSKEQMFAGRTKVLVFEADDRAVRSVLRGAGLVKTQKIQEVLEGASVEIVDRNLAQKLQEEIALAEAKGDGSVTYEGPEVAGVAVSSVVSNVGYGSVYVPASRIKLFGKDVNIPETCTYTGTANGALKVYAVPSLRLMGNFNLKGSSSTVDFAQCRDDNQRAMSLQRKAVEDLVHARRADIKNMFAPKGYVVEKRVSGDKVIFKVMVGKALGAVSQDKLTFYTLRKTENRLTKQVSIEEVPLLEGVISDRIADDHSWVVVKEAAKANQIRMGDFVKVVYKKGMFN